MRIPSLSEPRNGRKLEGRHVILFGAGTASEVGKGWSLRQESDLVCGVGKATALVRDRRTYPPRGWADFFARLQCNSIARSEGNY
jgi:hypothetical protein